MGSDCISSWSLLIFLLYFQRILFSRPLKRIPIVYSVVICPFAGPLGLFGSDTRKQNTAEASGRGVRDVAFSSMSHE